MKVLRVLSAVLLLSVLTISCVGDSKGKSSNLLPPLKIEIPTEVQDDPELVDLIQKSEKAINEFSDNVEILIEDLADIAKDVDTAEELSTFQKLKVGKALLEFGSHSTNAISALETFDNYQSAKEEAGEPLNDDQLRALAAVSDAFAQRMQEINKKFESASTKLEK